MELRRYRADDLAPLTELHNAALAHEHEFVPYTEKKLDEELQTSRSIWLAIEHDRIVGAAFYVPMWYGNEIVSLTEPNLDPTEIEAALLDWVEAEIDGDAAVIAVPSDQTDRKVFLEARGYADDGGMIQLVADLEDERPIPTLPEGYALRSLHPDERAAFVEMVNAAYDAERLSPNAFERWAENPGWTEDWIPVVAYRGALVAAVVARPDRDYNDHFGANRGYLGPAAVLPAHGKQGLGRALTAASLNVCRHQGMDRASLYTTQSNTAVHRLTEQLGFRATHRWDFLKKEV